MLDGGRPSRHSQRCSPLFFRVPQNTRSLPRDLPRAAIGVSAAASLSQHDGALPSSVRPLGDADLALMRRLRSSSRPPSFLQLSSGGNDTGNRNGVTLAA